MNTSLELSPLKRAFFKKKVHSLGKSEENSIGTEEQLDPYKNSATFKPPY